MNGRTISVASDTLCLGKLTEGEQFGRFINRRDADFVIIARTDARGVTSFEEVVSQLREMIHNGELRPGEARVQQQRAVRAEQRVGAGRAHQDVVTRRAGDHVRRARHDSRSVPLRLLLLPELLQRRLRIARHLDVQRAEANADSVPSLPFPRADVHDRG